MNTPHVIAVDDLQIGMQVQLDLGWMKHPFISNRFWITSPQELEKIRGLGVSHIKYFPHSEPPPAGVAAHGSAELDGGELLVMPPAAQAPVGRSSAGVRVPGGESPRVTPDAFLSLSHQACDESFGRATRAYRELVNLLPESLERARGKAEVVVDACVGDLLQSPHALIRLLSEGVGERRASHCVNVMALSVLLAQNMDLEPQAIQRLGMAALLHDMGKESLPLNIAEPLAPWTPEQRTRYEGHVEASVDLALRMGLSEEVQVAISQHHEFADGSGFPRQLMADDLSVAGQILALVNAYDRLCNPVRQQNACTPHEAMSVLYVQRKKQFRSDVLTAFIRMMGVYPPGSVVELCNDSFALVMAVNAKRPLRPIVLIYDENVPRDQAPEQELPEGALSAIRRSLKPHQLPAKAMRYLSPRLQVSYFFENAAPSDASEVPS